MALTSDALLLAAASNVVGFAIKGHLLTVISNLGIKGLPAESQAILDRSNLSHNGWAEVLSACTEDAIRVRPR
jgi:hypothetical protein